MTIEIKYIGHSCFVVSNGNSSIIIDPFITGNPTANINQNEIRVDDIFVTHAHGDHLGDAIEISKSTNTPLTAIFELANYCAKRGAKAQGVNIGGKIPFKWGNAYSLPAAHSSGTPDGQYGGEPSSVLIEIDGKRIYHAGDTGLHYDLKMVGEFYKPDVSMLPIGGYYTMGIDEAVQAAKWLGSKKIIPMHYNTFPPIKTDVEEFKKKVETETGCECIIMQPNQTIQI